MGTDIRMRNGSTAGITILGKEEHSCDGEPTDKKQRAQQWGQSEFQRPSGRVASRKSLRRAEMRSESKPVIITRVYAHPHGRPREPGRLHLRTATQLT
jgi:hypothetical protein